VIRAYAWLLRMSRPDLSPELRHEMTATFASVLTSAAAGGPLAAVRTAAAECADAALGRFRRDPLEPPRRPASGSRGGGLWPSLQDWRNAVRRAAANPGYAATVAGILALAIAVNTIVLSVADATLFRGLPYPNGPQLWDVENVDPSGKFSSAGLAPDTFAEWRAQTEIFDALEGWTYGTFTMLGGAEPRRINGAYVTPGLFPALGVEPIRGRGFDPDDGEPGRDARVIISERLWQQRFGGRDDAVGQVIVLDDRAFTVVGVMPAHFRFPASHQLVWLPATVHRPSGSRLQGYAKIKRGLTRDAAQARLDTLAAGLTTAKPREDGWRIRLTPVRHTAPNAAISRALQVLTAAVVLVLLVACANLANLGVAQALARRRELAIRAAMGATRSRLVRELFTEHLFLALLGGAAGLALAVWGVQLAIALAPAELTVWAPSEIRIDGRILIFTAALTFTSALLFGVFPAWRASRADAGEALKARTSGALAHGRLRAGLVIVEVALSVVLLTGAALLIRSFVVLVQQDPGFDPRGLVSVQFEVPTDRHPAPARRAFLEQVAAEIRRIPGVSAVSIANGVPASGGAIYFGELEIDGHAPEQGETVLPAMSVEPSYFTTLRIPIVAGRGIAADDPLTSVVVSTSLAGRLSGSAAGAIGTRFRLASRGPWYTVIGVAGEVRQARTMERKTLYEMYMPIWRPSTPPPAPPSPARAAGRSFVSYTIAVRAGAGATLAQDVKQAIWRVDAAQPIGDVLPAEALLAQSLSEDRFAAVLMGAFALLALVLAAAGLFGVLAHLVAQRRHEIGIRMALGASVRDVAQLIVGRGVGMALAGVAIGLAGSWAAARFLASQLYGVAPHDPLSFAGVPLVLLGVALLASWIPARRASTVDPVAALRAE